MGPVTKAATRGSHRRSVSASSDLSTGSDAPYFDALTAFEEVGAEEPEAGRDGGEAGAGACEPHSARRIDWLDEEQMLPPNERPLQERRQAVHSMRKIVLAEPDTDECAAFEDRSNAALERFLRARKYDVAVASAMYLEHRRWRAGFGWVQGPDNVPVQLAQRKVCMQGLCHDGLPFVIVVARNHRPTGREGVPELFRFFVYVMDTISTAMGPGGMFRILVDLRFMSRANADLSAMKVAFEVLQKGFPERMAHLWLAEPPGLFLALWKLMAPFVAPSTREKIDFVAGRDVASVVGKHVDTALLPEDWGGTTPLRPLDEGPACWEPPRAAPGQPPGRRY